MQEVERKFFPKKLPDLSQLTSTNYERYIIFNNNKIELRIQKKGSIYELEYKHRLNNLSRNELKITLSEAFFEILKKVARRKILRESYMIQSCSETTLKIYHGDYEGLVRVGAEFSNEEEAKHYIPPEWFGKEITNNPLGNDGNLVKLSKAEFQTELNKLLS